VPFFIAGEKMLLTIPGQPRAWQRARICGKRFFRSEEQRAHQAAVIAAWVQAGRECEGTGPLRVLMSFYFAKPKSNKTLYPMHRNDLDNLAKEILDALNERAFGDDGQVIELHCVKEWCEAGKERTVIRIVKA